MRNARSLGAMALLSILLSCAAETASGPRPVAGSDAYTVTTRGPRGSAGVLIAQHAALEDARAFCNAQGRRFRSLGSSVEREPFSSQLAYTVRFRCPAPGAPELERPTVNQAPDDLL